MPSAGSYPSAGPAYPGADPMSASPYPPGTAAGPYTGVPGSPYVGAPGNPYAGTAGNPPVYGDPASPPPYAGGPGSPPPYAPYSGPPAQPGPYPPYPPYPPQGPYPAGPYGVPQQPSYNPYSAPPAPAPYPYPPVAPPRKRGWGWIAGLVAGVLVVGCGLPVAGIAVYLGSQQDKPTTPIAQASTGATRSPQPRASRSPAPQPKAGDSQTAYENWAADRIQDALDAQEKAVLDGNAAGFTAAVATGQSKIVNDLKKEYANLRTLKTGSFAGEILSITGASGKAYQTDWSVRVSWHPCFGAPTCGEDEFIVATHWKLTTPDKAVLTAYAPDVDARTPRPWQSSDLVARVGARTVVATSKPYASMLPKIAEQAEAAAKVADRFAYQGKPPSRYVIFYAGGSAEWNGWYDWNPPSWSAGASIEVGQTSNIVLNGKVVQGWFMDNLLRHEMTHASTIPAGSRSEAWWLIEGIAEYAEMDGSAVSRYPDLDATRKFVKGSWDGDVDVSAPKDSDGDAAVAADYGVAFLAVRHLAEKYGEDKMLAFFMAVVQDGISETAASQQAFGRSWSAVSADLTSYIRSAV